MRLLALALVVALSLAASARAENWPQWRGPLGTGISAEKAAPREWSKEGEKNIAWRVEMPGEGNSTPIVWEDKVFVTCASKNNTLRGTYCYRRDNGELLWEQVVEYPEKEQTHNTNPPCSASPFTDGERVIVLHGSAGLFCYDLDGKPLWKKDLGKFEHIWGSAASPVIYKNLVIVNAGPGLNVFVAAFDKHSGEEVWRQEYEGMKSDKVEEFRGSWSTPVIYHDGQRDVMLLSLPEALRAVDPATGQEIWSCRGPSKLFYTSPIIAGDIVVAMCGYGGPAMAVRGGGKGDVTETHRLWVHPKNPQRVGSGVAVNGSIYIMNDNGVVYCIDAESGEFHWQSGRVGRTAWSSAVAVAGRIYFSDTSATTYVVEPSTEAYKQITENTLKEMMRASPAVSNGDIFLRTYEALYCVREVAAE